MLRSVAKHSPQLSQAVVDSGATDALVVCLEEFDPGVKEAAAWAIGYDCILEREARRGKERGGFVFDSCILALLL